MHGDKHEQVISVIIPYFQREVGVLRRALLSIVAQEDCTWPVHILIVDDSSPVAPEGELAGIDWPQGMLPKILKRPNGGPGAARNTGLEALSPQTRYVAFLDSDDAWFPAHLARAMAALDAGFDFYFSNFFQLEQSVGAFERAARIHSNQHPVISCGYDGIHAFSGDLFDQTLRGNVIGTPTVVYRESALASIRFDVSLRRVGEDYLFWMDVAREGVKVAFSARPEVRCGRGVNVYSGAGWGTDNNLERTHQQIVFFQSVSARYNLNSEQNMHVEMQIQELRTAFSLDLLHRIARGRLAPVRLLASHLLVDPMTYAKVPLIAIMILCKRTWKTRS